MITVTLDTNILLEVDECRSELSAIRALLELKDRKELEIALVASSAAEKQKNGEFLDDFGVFVQRAEQLGFGGCQVLPTIGYWGMSFWGESIYPTETQKIRERFIFETLFPGKPYSWIEFEEQNKGHVSFSKDCREFVRWRNRLLDAQAFWAHDDQNRDAFLTLDGNFVRKLGRHPEFNSSVISTASEFLTALEERKL